MRLIWLDNLEARLEVSIIKSRILLRKTVLITNLVKDLVIREVILDIMYPKLEFRRTIGLQDNVSISSSNFWIWPDKSWSLTVIWALFFLILIFLIWTSVLLRFFLSKAGELSMLAPSVALTFKRCTSVEGNARPCQFWTWGQKSPQIWSLQQSCPGVLTFCEKFRCR